MQYLLLVIFNFAFIFSFYLLFKPQKREGQKDSSVFLFHACYGALASVLSVLLTLLFHFLLKLCFYTTANFGFLEQFVFGAAVSVFINLAYYSFASKKFLLPETNYLKPVKKMLSCFFLLAISVLFGILLEIFLFNFENSRFSNDKYFRSELDLSAAGIAGGGKYENNTIILPNSGGELYFYNLYYNGTNITINTSADDIHQSECGIYFSDASNSYGFIGGDIVNFNPGGTQNIIRGNIRSNDYLVNLKLSFAESNAPLRIHSIVVNERPALEFSSFRFAFLFLVIFLILLIQRTKTYRIVYNPFSKKQGIFVCLAALACVVYSLFIFVTIKGNEPVYLEYPLTTYIGTANTYVQQMDAFIKGQINLDIPVDETMNSLHNIYDPSERTAKDAVAYWDRALYDGKWYCYFGLSPILLVYAPFYLLTGNLPANIFVTTVQAIIGIIFIFAAMRELVIALKIKANYLLYLLGNLAVVSGSLLFMIQSTCDHYNIALLAGVISLPVFIFFAFRASRAKNKIARGILFAASALAFILIVLSRPNVAILGIAFAVPIFLSILFSKEKSGKAKIADVLCFLIPIAVGAAGIMYYNYIRFDSPFEFGTTYQITISDVHYNKLRLSLDNILGTLYSYFIQPLDIKQTFPFLSIDLETYDIYQNFKYQDYNAGLFCIPVNLFVFYILGRKKDKNQLRKWTLYSVLIGIFALSYFNFCMAGILIRYTFDMGVAMSMLCVLLMLLENSKRQEKRQKIGDLYYLSAGMCILSIAVGMLLVFSNMQNYIFLYHPDTYLKIANLFRF